MATLATLVVRITADAGELRKELASSQGLAQRFAGGLQSVGKAAIGVGLGAATAAVGGFAAVVHSTLPLASEFQSQLSGLQIAASGSGLSFAELHDAALQVGGDTSLLGVSATGAADAMTGLYKAGLSTNEIFGDLQGYMAGTAELGGALRAAIDLAAASELNMVEASDLGATVLATFGGELETAGERAAFVNTALDNMVRAADASVAEVSGLALGLKNVGPVASSMGISIEDTNNALAILSTRGINGAEAGTALRSMLANLRRPTTAVQDALSELNVSLYDAEGNFVGMPRLIANLERSFAGLTQEQQDMYSQVLAGTYGMNALNTLLAEGTTGWQDMAEATANAAGIQEQATAKAGTFAGQMEALEGSIETLKIGIGEAFLPIAQQLVELFSGLVAQYGPQIVDFFSKTLASAMEQAPVIWDAISTAVQSVITAFQEFWPTIQPIVEQVAGWISQNVQLNDVLAALGIAIASVIVPAIASIVVAVGPVLLIFAAVVAAVAGLRQAWETNFLGIRDKAQVVADFLRENVPLAMAAITTFWNETLRPAIEEIVAWLGENIPLAMQAVATFWTETLYPALNDLWQFTNEYLIPLVNAFIGVLGELIRIGFEAVRAFLVTYFFPTMQSLYDWLWPKIQPAVDWIKGVLEGLAGEDGAFGKVKKAIGWVIDRLNDLKGILDVVHIPAQLLGHSPPPFAQSLWNIAEAAQAATRAVGQLAPPSGQFGGLVPAGAGAGARGGSPTIIVVQWDRRDFEEADGELDPYLIGDKILRDRMY